MKNFLIVGTIILVLSPVFNIVAHAADVQDDDGNQNAVDASNFDISGIKLHMPAREVPAILEHLQKKDGGKIKSNDDYGWYYNNKYTIMVYYSQPT